MNVVRPLITLTMIIMSKTSIILVKPLSTLVRVITPMAMSLLIRLRLLLTHRLFAKWMFWLIAAMMANIVWCLPQFSLGVGAIQQNLFPSLDGSESAKWIIGFVLLAAATVVVRAYDSDNRGVKIFELILKSLVGIVT